MYKWYKRLVYTHPDLLARFCKVNLSNAKNLASFFSRPNWLRSRFENATPNLCWVICALLGVLCIFRDCIRRRRRRRHTFGSLWGPCLRFASLWRANSFGDSCVLGVHISNVCWGLLFCSSFKSVLDFRKAYIFKSLLKVYYRSLFNESSKAFIFQNCAECLHPE